MGEKTRASGRVLTAAALCAGVGIALALTGCAEDVRATSGGGVAISSAGAPPLVDCPSGRAEFGPARPGAAEAMVPGAPLFAEVCRYEWASDDDGSALPPLTGSGRIEGSELAVVVEAFNAAASPANPRRCGGLFDWTPATFVSTTFHYADGMPLRVDWSGPCNQSNNGTSTAEGLASEIPPYWTNPEWP